MCRVNESTTPAQSSTSVGERRRQADSTSSSGTARPCFSSAGKCTTHLVAAERSTAWRLPISTAPPLLLRRLKPKPPAPFPAAVCPLLCLGAAPLLPSAGEPRTPPQ
jgi:hypothetical protein